MDRLQRMLGAGGMGGPGAAGDSPQADTSEQIYISSLALLKMLKHGRAGVPLEVMGLMLGEFVDEYTVKVVDVFAMPQSGTGVSVEAVDPVFQTKMLDMLKQVGRYAHREGLGRASGAAVGSGGQRWRLAALNRIAVCLPGLLALGLVIECAASQPPVQCNLHCVIPHASGLPAQHPPACRPEMVVGWYHSHPGFGCWLSGVDVNTQQSFEALNQRAVAGARCGGWTAGQLCALRSVEAAAAVVSWLPCVTLFAGHLSFCCPACSACRSHAAAAHGRLNALLLF